MSTDDRRQTSLPRQIDMCRQAAEHQGYEVLHTLSDDGYSGALLERPGLERLMALVRSGQIQAVFVTDGDRLSREPAHAWLIQQEMRQHHVTLYAAGQPIDDSPEGEMKDGLLAMFAKYERLKSRQRMLDGKKRRAGWLKPPRSGRPMGAQMPLGYIYVPDTPETPGHIVKDPEESALVDRIFRMCLDGSGIWTIARILTPERILTKMDQQPRANSKFRDVGVWNVSSVSRILHNETYWTGVLYWNRRQSVEPRDDRRRKPKNLSAG